MRRASPSIICLTVRCTRPRRHCEPSNGATASRPAVALGDGAAAGRIKPAAPYEEQNDCVQADTKLFISASSNSSERLETRAFCEDARQSLIQDPAS